MREPLDDDTLEEIQMVATIMVTATATTGPLPQEQIDGVLGLG